MDNARLIAARSHAKLGHPLCLCREKNPGYFGKAWQDRVWTAELVESAFAQTPSLNLGLKLGPRYACFIDVECDSEQAKHDLEKFVGSVSLPPTPCWGSTRGQHSLWRLDPPQFELLKNAGASGVFKIGELELRLGNAEAALQSLIPPSTTDGFTREWQVSIFDCPVAQFPDELFDDLLLAVIERPTRIVESTPTTLPVKFGRRVGDLFNHRGTWEEVLLPHGWSKVAGYDGVQHWCRPGKRGTVSATVGFCSTDCRGDCLYIFSSAPEIAPLKSQRAYSKFEAYAVLNHGATSNGQ